MIKLKHFKSNEFDSPDLPNSGINMDNEFLQMLDNAREYSTVPFKITSGYRTESHNNAIYAKLGKKPIASSHLKGKAVDIACTDSRSRHIILTALIKAGFTRFGISHNFIHTDSDEEKSQNVIWTY
jgi:uncharacterized protein YcbK (DUF882 family)